MAYSTLPRDVQEDKVRGRRVSLLYTYSVRKAVSSQGVDGLVQIKFRKRRRGDKSEATGWRSWYQGRLRKDHAIIRKTLHSSGKVLSKYMRQILCGVERFGHAI